MQDTGAYNRQQEAEAENEDGLKTDFVIHSPTPPIGNRTRSSGYNVLTPI